MVSLDLYWKKNPDDINILIEEYAEHKGLIKFQYKLETATGKSVDIVIEKNASPIIYIELKGKLLM